MTLSQQRLLNRVEGGVEEQRSSFVRDGGNRINQK